MTKDQEVRPVGSGQQSAYARAYEDMRRRQQFEQIAKLKKELAKVLPNVEPHELLVMIGRCTHYDWGDRKQLGPEETVLYKYLEQEQLKPRSVYRWFRLSIMPEDVRSSA